jgi:5'-nucleotidase
MRIIVTNDDGIEGVGLHVLAAALVDTGHEVVVVAPDRDFSGAGASLGRITIDDDIAAARVAIPDRADIESWALDGPPGLCVLASCMGAFGDPPDVIVSGINAGLNTGRAVLHSGTVGAALTAQNFGISGLAVSAESGPERDWHWHTAAQAALDVLDTLLTAPPRTVLNLNVPARDRGDVQGLRWARLAPFGEVQTATAEITDERLQFTFRATGALPDLGTDQGLVAAGYATVTVLAGIAEAWPEAPAPTGDVEVVEAMGPGTPLHPVHRVPDTGRFRSLHHDAAPRTP